MSEPRTDELLDAIARDTADTLDRCEALLERLERDLLVRLDTRHDAA